MSALQAFVLKPTHGPSPLGWAEGSGALSAQDPLGRHPTTAPAPGNPGVYPRPVRPLDSSPKRASTLGIAPTVRLGTRTNPVPRPNGAEFHSPA